MRHHAHPTAAGPRRRTRDRGLPVGATRLSWFVLLAGLTAIAAYARRASLVRVDRRWVAAGASTALGDSGRFTLPTPAGRVLTRADAESASVAKAYWWVDRAADGSRRELRRPCGRTIYVHPVMDPIPARASGYARRHHGPRWVVPVCDGAGVARRIVAVPDAPTGLRVRIGPRPVDVPRLDFTERFTGGEEISDDPVRWGWDGGLPVSPEQAVSHAGRMLSGAGARVSGVPEAHVALAQMPRDRDGTRSPMQHMPSCMRWKLPLDRIVRLRGRESGRVIESRVVYVMRDRGCHVGPLTLFVPLASQPATLHITFQAPLSAADTGCAPPTILFPGQRYPRCKSSPRLRTMHLRQRLRAEVLVVRPAWFEPADPVDP